MLCTAVFALATLSFADDFDRLEGPSLSGIPKHADSMARESLTIVELGALPNILAGARSPFLVVKTDEGNYARLLVSPALRKPPGGQGEPIPILIVERFDTFEGNSATRRIARGRDLTLFDGFRLDLDSGQVVPDGQGGDLQFVGKGESGARLTATKPAQIFTLAKTPLPTSAGGSKPSVGRTIAPEDFAGTYRLFANGQSSGRLELKVGEGGGVTGRFRSDQTGGAYKVTGDVGKDSPNRIRFSAELPRTRQEFDGLLFLDGKGAISGSYTLLDRTFGFFAVREGGTYLPDGEDLGGKGIEAERPAKVVVDLTSAGCTLAGKSLDDARLATAMKAAVNAEPSSWAQIRVAKDVPAGRLLKVIEILTESGATTIRVLPSETAKP
ncbi:MAG: hypothetical protein JWN86_1081 [Planctomycetota bacterium]|nr:hypothetical protein [Planctomycetota bacterium]